MGKYVLAPDSFKGTLNANEVCEIWEKVIRRYEPDAEILSQPISDGGEGWVDAYKTAIGGTLQYALVTGPTGKPVQAHYLKLEDGTCILETAACAGLILMGDLRDPLHATTYGIGELLIHAVEHGATHIILGLGGSATNDCGIGMAAALGYAFYDSHGNALAPTAENLGKVSHISGVSKLGDMDLSAACDVKNPLCGPNGATFTYGPQKGVTPHIAPMLEDSILHFANVIRRDLGIDIISSPGAGAAGGLGAAVLAFLHGRLVSGIETFLQVVNFHQKIAGADYIFTGEGRIDGQSIYGKVPIGVATAAQKAGVPCIALCGSTGKDVQNVFQYGITAVFSSVSSVMDYPAMVLQCRSDLELLMESVFRFACAAKHNLSENSVSVD